MSKALFLGSFVSDLKNTLSSMLDFCKVCFTFSKSNFTNYENTLFIPVPNTLFRVAAGIYSFAYYAPLDGISSSTNKRCRRYRHL